MPIPNHKDYYSNVNSELLNLCPEAETVLEFGCGAGRFLGAYKNQNPASTCVGFERFKQAGKEAQAQCDQVVIGDAEDPSLLKDSFEPNSFSLIIYGDVLEHFVDPWAALSMHLEYLKPGGTVCACIPNASNWSLIFSLINGDFTYQDAGLLDRTHLRFFTYSTIKKLFEDANLIIETLKPRQFMLKETPTALPQLAKIFGKPIEQISPARKRDWSTFQYLVRARKPA